MSELVVRPKISPDLDMVVSAKNPIIQGRGVCDPHMHVFGNRVYLYASHDSSPESTDYWMEDWQIWSSTDLVEWRLEATVEPGEFFTGPTKSAWAVDAAHADGNYYLYFSHGNTATGVAVAATPIGPFRDALGKPLLDGSLSSTREYDPAVFIDDDERAYLVFGGPEWAYGDGAGYFIAQLNPDMVSLAERPRRLLLDHEGDDKASLNKIGGIYYLTYGSNYSISNDVYGPYAFLGNTGASEDHGSYFERDGQIFNAFTIFDPTMTHRASGICYVHQKVSGEIVVDPVIVEYGVGHYDGRWNKIEAEWFMKANGVIKKENPRHGFDISCPTAGTLFYPNVHDIERTSGIAFFASCSSSTGARILIYDGEAKGKLLATCEIPGGTDISWRSYRISTATFGQQLPHKIDLYFDIVVAGSGELRIDYFKLF